MADIELVIKLDEDAYKDLIQTGENTIHLGILLDLRNSVRNGTLLPKGHGRIGDLDALRDEVSSWGMNDYEPSDFIDEIDRADTIIEADKEHEDGKIT